MRLKNLLRSAARGLYGAARSTAQFALEVHREVQAERRGQTTVETTTGKSLDTYLKSVKPLEEGMARLQTLQNSGAYSLREVDTPYLQEDSGVVTLLFADNTGMIINPLNKEIRNYKFIPKEPSRPAPVPEPERPICPEVTKPEDYLHEYS